MRTSPSKIMDWAPQGSLFRRNEREIGASPQIQSLIVPVSAQPKR